MKIFDYKFSFYCVLFLGASFILLFFDLLDIMYTTADDLSISQTSYLDYIDIGFRQGRIGFFILGFLIQFPYMFESFIIVKVLHYLSLILAVGAIAYLLILVFKNKYIGILYAFLAVFLWQNGSHNMLTSYYFYIPFGIFLYVSSLILFVMYFESERKGFLYASLLLWLIVAFAAIDFWVVYLLGYVFIANLYSDKVAFIPKLYNSIRKSFWHTTLALICVLLYLWFIVYSGGAYGGRTLEMDFIRMIKTLFVFATGLFPGVQYWHQLIQYDLSHIVQLLNYKSILLLVLLLYVILKFKDEIRKLDNNINVGLLIVIALYFVIAPVFMISWTIKYQNWALERGVHDYLYSSFSYLGWIFLIVILAARIRSNWLYYIFASIVGVLFILVQLHNAQLEHKQAQYSEKLFLLNALLTTNNQLEKYNCIEAPSLWDDGVAVREAKLNYWEAFADVWTSYAKNKYKKSIKIVESGKCDARADLYRGGNKGSSYMIFSANDEAKIILTIKSKCNQHSPCYLLQNGIFNGVDDVAFDGYAQGDSILLTEKLAKPSSSTRMVNAYSINQSIPIDSILSLIDYRVNEIFKPIVRFDSNFYAEESDGELNWRWASKGGEISIFSPNMQNVVITFDVQTAKPTELDVEASDSKKKIAINDSDRHQIELNTKLNKGVNIIKIATAGKSIKLSESDDRLFAFRIFSIKIKQHNAGER